MVTLIHGRRSPHGERGLKYDLIGHDSILVQSRSPHGERGLKFGELAGAGGRSGRSPHGERGLKYHSGLCDRHCKSKSLSSWRAWIEIRLNVFCNAWERCRSPHGERGLKFDDIRRLRAVNRSLSSWRAWIEIGSGGPAGLDVRSLSSWRAWIEIYSPPKRCPSGFVALLMESVD